MNILALLAFATMDEAAIDGLKSAYRNCDARYECGGVVTHLRTGGYTWQGLTTSNRPNGLSLEDLYKVYDKSVVADFHTHPCVGNKPLNNFFSMGDVLSNDGLHTVGYMLSLCDLNIRRFDPAQDERDDEEIDFHSGRVLYMTSGHIVGNVP